MGQGQKRSPGSHDRSRRFKFPPCAITWDYIRTQNTHTWTTADTPVNVAGGKSSGINGTSRSNREAQRVLWLFLWAGRLDFELLVIFPSFSSDLSPSILK
ncbi:uncharacterized protein YALI1_B01292g [Yarrowia lipolytica]|uniref:Uncharacterized protein n=1 Tax=Yarrowia lipolytica TaxID=4952 RepID=A0A1D8N5X1_YARLL|nr:hypothetical protein YALI1_B01292g [Yarrowia lipolytica]